MEVAPVRIRALAMPWAEKSVCGIFLFGRETGGEIMANSTVDGSVVIDVNMDVGQAEKRLGKLRGDIKKTEKEIADATAARDNAEQKSVFQAAELDAEKAKLQEIKDRLADIRAMSRDKSINIDTREEYKAQIPAIQQELSDQQARVRMLQAEWNKTETSVDRYSQKIESATQKLDEQKTEAGILTQQIDEATRKQNGFSNASDAAEKSMDRLYKRIRGEHPKVCVNLLCGVE